MARPTLYSKELGDEICGQISVGVSLATICKADSMPCPGTVYSWLRTDEEFLKNYENAKADQADYFVEQILTIPDEESDVQRARLKVDVRKWSASKYKPKKYGDRTQIDLDATHRFSDLTDEQLLAELKRAEAALAPTGVNTGAAAPQANE